RADLICDPLGPEHLGLHEVSLIPPNVPKVEDFIITGDRAFPLTDLYAAFVDDPTPPVNKVDIRVATEMLRHFRQRTWKIVIVTVQIGDDVACRPLYALVDRVSLTAVLFAHPISNPILEFPNDFDAVIRASAVDDDVFEVRVALVKYRRNRLLQI